MSSIILLGKKREALLTCHCDYLIFYYTRRCLIPLFPKWNVYSFIVLKSILHRTYHLTIFKCIVQCATITTIHVQHVFTFTCWNFTPTTLTSQFLLPLRPRQPQFYFPPLCIWTSLFLRIIVWNQTCVKRAEVRVQAELPCVVGKNCAVLQGHYLQIKKVCRHWCHVLTVFHDIYYRQRIFCGPFQKDKSTRCWNLGRYF